MSDAPPPTESSPKRAPRPPWQRRVFVYALVGLGAFFGARACERMPTDVELHYVLSTFEVRAPGGERLNRRAVVQLDATVVEGEETVARSSFDFRGRVTPLKTVPTTVRLRAGPHDVRIVLTVRLPGGDETVMVVRRSFEMEPGQAQVLVEVGR